MLNQVIIEGRLTKDPIIRKTPSGLAVCNFTVANEKSSKRGKDTKPLFVNVTAFGTQAETVVKCFHSGKEIIILGRLEEDTYTNRAGEVKSRMFVVLSGFEFPITTSSNRPSIEDSALDLAEATKPRLASAKADLPDNPFEASQAEAEANSRSKIVTDDLPDF